MHNKKIAALLLTGAMVATSFMPAVPAVAKTADAVQSADSLQSDYQEAVRKHEQAQAKLNTAAKALNEAKSAYDTTGRALKTAQTTVNNVDSSLSTADIALTAAQETLETAKADVTTAQASYDAVRKTADASAKTLADAKAVYDATAKEYNDLNSMTDDQLRKSAQAKADAAKKANDDAISASDKAQQTMNTAKTAMETAEASYNKDKAEVDALETEYQKAKAAKDSGTLGFYEAMGATAALEQLNKETSWVKEYVKTPKEDPDDATSFDNMLRALDYLDQFNSLRKSIGLSELKVTDSMMLYAQADADYYNQRRSHAKQFNVGENCNGNTSDPWYGWYTEEKEEYDKGNTTFSETGHYQNIVNTKYTVTGFGVYGTSSACQTFYWEAPNNDTTYTVEEYRQRFKNYTSGIESTISAYETAEKKVEPSKTAYDKAKADYDTAETAYKSAAANAEKTAADLKTANDELANVEATIKDRSQAKAAAKAKMDAAKPAYDSAQAAADKDAAALKTAETALQSKKDTQASAQKAVDTAAANITELNKIKADPSGYLKPYQDAESKAEDTLDDAQDDYDEAKEAEEDAADAVKKAYDDYYNQSVDVSTLKVTGVKKSYTYTGKAIRPIVMLPITNGYSVEYYSNTNPGIAKIVIRGTEKNTGKQTKTFKILPKAMKLTSVKGQKKTVKVAWKKQSKKLKKQITGYQIRYATKASMTSAKKVKANKNRSSYTVKNLKKNKTYYVQIRSYKTVVTKKATKTNKAVTKDVYSKWSNVKYAKVK